MVKHMHTAVSPPHAARICTLLIAVIHADMTNHMVAIHLCRALRHVVTGKDAPQHSILQISSNCGWYGTNVKHLPKHKCLSQEGAPSLRWRGRL